MSNNVIKLVELVKDLLENGNQDKAGKILNQVSVGILKDALKVAFEGSSDEASALLCHKLFARGVSLEDIRRCIHSYGSYRFVESLIAYKQHCSEVAIFFIKNGYNINGLNNHLDDGHLNILHLAASRGYKLVKAVLERNTIDVNSVTLNGHYSSCTPLHMAALSGDVKVAKLLVEAGADIHAVEANLNTPFKRALNSRNFEFAMYMIEVEIARGNLPLDKINLFVTKVYDVIRRNHQLDKNSFNENVQNLSSIISKFCKSLCASRFGRQYENNITTFYKRALFKGLQMRDDGSTSVENFKFQVIEEIRKFVDKSDYFTDRHKIVLSFKDTVDQEKLWTDIFQRFFDLEIDEAKKFTNDFLDSNFCKTQKAIYQSMSEFNVPEDVIKFHILAMR